MTQTENFNMRISKQDRAIFSYVAKHYQRTKSDTFRVIIRDAYRAVKAEKANGRKAISKPAVA